MKKSIRIVFGVFSLVMLALMVWRIIGGVWTPLNWGMSAIAFTCCLLVFINFVYIFNYSYSLCVLLNSLLIWIALPSPAAGLMASVGVLYGARLFWFTWQRMRSDSYADKAKGIEKADEYFPTPAKVALWVQCGLLHTFHLMALWFVAGKAVLTSGVIAGVAIMFAGTLIEAVADSQKQAGKKQNKNGLVAAGLFARWRHPNYAGEILFHAGLIVAGLASVSSIPDALTVVVAPLYIIILMVSEAGRADGVHQDKYGETEEYQAYRKNSGTLVPKLF